MEDINNIPYEEWYYRIIEGAALYTNSNDELWDYWSKIVVVIPEKYRLLLFLTCIYTECDFLTDKCFEYLEKLIVKESKESIAFRKEQNLKSLELIYHMEGIELVDADGFLEVFRGVHNASDNFLGQHEESRKIEKGISYTYDELIAKWFAIRTQGTDCKVISGKVHIDDVLAFNLDRRECEIVIKPPYLGSKLRDIKVEKILPHISIMREFDKTRRIS